MVQGAKEAIVQMIEGRDFDPPAKLVARVKAEDAVRVMPGFPYSLATNVLHADFWNRVWIDRLEGRRARSFTEDWREPGVEEWDTVRERFLAGLNRALEIASAEPFEHKLKSDEVAAKTLIQIAVHTSYHLGEIKLMKRVMWKLARGA
jgi:hypothetical protein